MSVTTQVNSGLFGIGFRFLAVAVILASAGHVQGSHEKAGQRPEALGDYLLISANAQELPALVSESGSGKQEVTGGSVLLEADGTYIWRTFYRYTDRGGAHVSESSGRGSYSQRGTSIIFLFEADASRLEGTLDSDTLTIQTDVPMVYRKVFGADGLSLGPREPFRVFDQGGGAPPAPPPTIGTTFSLSLDPGHLRYSPKFRQVAKV